MNKISSCIISNGQIPNTLLHALEEINGEIVIMFNDNVSDNDIAPLQTIYKNIHTFKEHFVNFAQFRNITIQKAHFEWIFMIDTDELPTKELIQVIKKNILTDKYDAYKVKRIHFINDPPSFEDHWTHTRLFRNYCTYFGSTHETLTGYKSAYVITDKNCYLLHDIQREIEEKKGTNYLKTLEEKLASSKKNKNDDLIHYYEFKVWTQKNVYLKELNKNLSDNQRNILYKQYEEKKSQIKDIYDKIITGKLILQ